MPNFKQMSDDQLWRRLEDLENETMVVRLELTARAMAHPSFKNLSDAPTMLRRSQLVYLSKQFYKAGPVEELKRCADALSQCVDHHLGDDVGDGLANKIKDLLLAAHEAVRQYDINKDPQPQEKP